MFDEATPAEDRGGALPQTITSAMVNALVPVEFTYARYTASSWAKVRRRAQVKVFRHLVAQRAYRRENERRVWARLEDEMIRARGGSGDPLI
ncbi:MAG: hypothetical protein EB075_14005 [Bacteroidetes bacterium]|nr:hypothetical protein [Bacteroidota bacterium]